MKDFPLLQYEAEGISKVIEKNGKNVFKIDIPNQMQGYTYYIEFSSKDMPNIEKGPYKVELILCNDFLLYNSDLTVDDIIYGYSNLKLGTPPKKNS